MDLNDKDEILIEKYLQNGLSAQQLQAFEARMQTDKDFKTEVQLRRNLAEAAKETGRKNLKNLFEKADAKLDNEATIVPMQKAKTRSLNLKKWAAAAAILFLLGASLWWFLQPPANEQLFAKYYEPFPNLEAPLEKNAASSDPVKLGFQAYEKGNYQEAIDHFQAVSTLPNGMVKSSVDFYKGLCYLAIFDYEETESLLKSASLETNSSYGQVAEWYLALTYLKMGQISQSQTILEAISKNGKHPFQKNAIVVLEEM